MQIGGGAAGGNAANGGANKAQADPLALLSGLLGRDEESADLEQREEHDLAERDDHELAQRDEEEADLE